MSARLALSSLLVCAGLLGGCRDTTESTAKAPSPPPVEISLPAQAADAAVPDVPPDPTFAVAPLDLGGQAEEQALRALGAIAAWDAVVNRGDYLGRRQRRGVIYGRLGGVTERYRWLIDDTEGAGALAVRLAYPGTPELAAGMREGQRLAVWGAWHVDEARAWYWLAERVAELPRASSSSSSPGSGAAVGPGLEDKPFAFASGHEILEIAEPPAEARLLSEHIAKSQGWPGEIIFTVRSSPSDPADGWDIADTLAGPPIARLQLPGERKSYGAQDFRSPSERFRLARGGQYVVRVQKFFAPRPGQTLTLRAAEPPRRIIGKARKGRAPVPAPAVPAPAL